MDSEKRSCGNCKNATGEGSVLYCTQRTYWVNETMVCDRLYLPLAEGEQRSREIMGQTKTTTEGVVFTMDNQDRHLIAGAPQYVATRNPLPGIVVDIGAHVGTFSLWCAIRGSKVYAYEPSVVNFEYLKKNIEDNKSITKGRVIPHRYAVTEKSGETLELKSGGIGTGQKSVDFSAKKHGTECQATTISLKDLLIDVLATEGRIDYLKCDIEGGEFRFLGMDSETRELLGKVGFVEMSIHPLTHRDYYDWDGPQDFDFTGEMRKFLLSCGLPPERFLFC